MNEIYKEEDAYIYYIAQEINWRKCVEVVELGTRTGKSALMLKELCPDINLTTYDNVYSHQTAKALKNAGIKYVIGDTRTIKHNHKRIDLLFCDTLHTARQLIDEYNNFYAALHKRSVIVVDDVFLNDKSSAFAIIGKESRVVGRPIRSSGLGLIYGYDWQPVELVVGESIPPIMAKIWERYNRFKERCRVAKK